ncbi:MAG: hypothetical protein EBZ48_05705 [Proteobacteria bacterium]|nr:hypothetical protein [Pseudomonadota bacterium]
MNSSSKRGNDPERWEALLAALDDKLQLGLLEHLKRVNSYHFEENILYVECADVKDHTYLTKDPVLQQLKLLAEDSIKVESVKIKKLG